MKLRDLFELTLSDTLINSYWASFFKRGSIYPYIGIDLIFGNGKRIRISTQPITMIKEDGNSIYFEPLLLEEPTINESYNWSGGSPSQRTFTISLQALRVDPLSIVKGGDLLAGSAEISIISNDVPYERRFVFMVGDMVGGITFGANNESIEFDITDPKLTVDRIIPQFLTSNDTLGNYIDDKWLGFRYPIVYNSFKKVPCIQTIADNYTPRYMVCYGHDITISKVYRNGAEVLSYEVVQQTGNIPSSNLYQWKVNYFYDLLGRPYTGLSFQNSTGYILDENTFSSNDSLYADVVKNNKLSVIDTIRMLLVDHTGFGDRGIDEVLFSRSKGKEPPFLSCELCINGSGENTVSTMEYITSTLLSSFPMIQLAYSSQGIAPVFTDRTILYSVLHLVRGQNLLFDRVSAFMETSKEEIYNSFTLQYDYNAMEDNYNKLIERNSNNNNLCSISESKMGKREMDVIQSINISNDITANYVIDWYTNHYTPPSYTISYVGSCRLFFLLKIGDNIELTDDKLGLDKVKGTVTDLSYERGQTVVGFRLWLIYDVISSANT